MKKIKYLLIIGLIFCLTGCFGNDSMDNIKITTSIYPVEYIVNYLYGEHSTITSIYPKDTDSGSFKVTNTLLDQYKDNDLFIFNGIGEEKDHVKYLIKKNNDLKIIDVASNMQYDSSIEELWLDPNNLLTMANNIRKGFKEYIKSSYLIDDVDEKYEKLKIELTSLDGKFYSVVRNSSNNTIIVSDDAFKYLEKYGIEVISLDPDTVKEKNKEDAKRLVNNKTCSYVFVKYKEDNKDMDSFINKIGATKLELYTMTNLKDVNVDKNDYITLMNQNLDALKKELYK